MSAPLSPAEQTAAAKEFADFWAGKGYEKALCVARENTVTVLTGTALTAPDAALLLTVITEASGVSPANIRMTGI